MKTTAKQIKELAAQSTTAQELTAKLLESLGAPLSNGQKCFTVHGMGQASVRGTFQGIANGGMAKFKRESDGAVFNVMPHLVFAMHTGAQ